MESREDQPDAPSESPPAGDAPPPDHVSGDDSGERQPIAPDQEPSIQGNIQSPASDITHSEGEGAPVQESVPDEQPAPAASSSPVQGEPNGETAGDAVEPPVGSDSGAQEVSTEQPQPAAPTPVELEHLESEAPDGDDEPLERRQTGKKLAALLLAAALLLGAVFSFRFFSGDVSGPDVAAGPFSWTTLPFPPIEPRYGHAAVWTGSKMIVWGGFSGVAAQTRQAGAGIRSDGAELDVESGEWALVPPAPLAHRPDMPAAWTGKEMIVWGGEPGLAASGIAYDPAAKTWRQLPASPLEARGGQSSVWTGTEVILWGGTMAFPERPAEPPNLAASGAAFNPQTNAWRGIPVAPIGPRDGHSAIWTGKEMIVWGGTGATGGGDGGNLPDGGAFDPSANTWRAVPAAPAAVEGAAVWSGDEMLVWGDRRERAAAGGQSPASLRYVMEGFAFNPGSQRWRRLPRAPLSLRTEARAIWSGTRLFVWGGLQRRQTSPQSAAGPAADGAAYSPATHRWERIPAAPIKGRDVAFSLVAAGDSVIVWGGKASERGGQGTTLADGARLSPAGR